MQFLHTTSETYCCENHTYLLMIILPFNRNQRKVYVLILIHKLRSNAVLRWDKWACLRYPPLAIVGYTRRLHRRLHHVAMLHRCKLFSFPKFLIRLLLENWGFKNTYLWLWLLQLENLLIPFYSSHDSIKISSWDY